MKRSHAKPPQIIPKQFGGSEHMHQIIVMNSQIGHLKPEGQYVYPYDDEKRPPVCVVESVPIVSQNLI